MNLSIGQNIRKIRKLKKWPMEALAEKAGVSMMCVWRVETGRTENPQFETIERIAKALDVSIDSLLPDS